MKKALLTILVLLLPVVAGATKRPFLKHQRIQKGDIPIQFMSSSETAILEWGCPVSEIVEARSQAEALHQISTECMEEATRQATNHPGVFEVIKADVIWPDITITKEIRGYRLEGTFFLETLVLQGAEGLKR